MSIREINLSVYGNRFNAYTELRLQRNSSTQITLLNGDVVSAINGLEMNSPDQALLAYTKLKTANHLSVAIERNGQKITKDYNIR